MKQIYAERRIGTTQSSSDSDSEDLSEAIIILGKGVSSFNAKYGCLTHCIAGIGKNGSWIRLYPLFAERVLPGIQFVEKFDIIKAEYRETKPEPTRPESRRIHPESVLKIDHVKSKKEQIQILEKFTETGVFLHDDSWNGKKTLGLIEPRNAKFFLLNGTPKVRFLCGDSCPGHVCEVKELEKTDQFGRVISEEAANFEKHFEALSGKKLRFVMGTDGRHPHIWLIVSIHVLEVI
ncbi:MAG: hypothetical protein ABSA75_14745 [Candidatus Bathyarchaeia archaeon]|jgi:hypothetical protein